MAEGLAAAMQAAVVEVAGLRLDHRAAVALQVPGLPAVTPVGPLQIPAAEASALHP